MKRAGFCIILTGTLLAGCSIYRDKQQPQDPARIQRESNFRSVFENVLQKNQCLKCHNSQEVAAGGVALDRYDLVRANLDRLERSTLIEKTMPPGRPLSALDQSILRAWLDRGAPEFEPVVSGSPSPMPSSSPDPSVTPAPTPLPLEPRFSSIKARILDKKCTFCHSAGGTVAKIPLTSYTEILNSPREIVLPKNADESGLVIYSELEPGDPKLMPPPKSGFAPLSLEETKTIRAWIMDGAKDN